MGLLVQGLDCNRTGLRLQITDTYLVAVIDMLVGLALLSLGSNYMDTVPMKAAVINGTSHSSYHHSSSMCPGTLPSATFQYRGHTLHPTVCLDSFLHRQHEPCLVIRLTTECNITDRYIWGTLCPICSYMLRYILRYHSHGGN